MCASAQAGTAVYLESHNPHELDWGSSESLLGGGQGPRTKCATELLARVVLGLNCGYVLLCSCVNI